jgi:hypothetical protein
MTDERESPALIGEQGPEVVKPEKKPGRKDVQAQAKARVKEKTEERGQRSVAADRSVTGVELIDGLPFFGEVDGVRMNRRQWIDATYEDRKAAFIEALTAPDEVADASEEVEE